MAIKRDGVDLMSAADIYDNLGDRWGQQSQPLGLSPKFNTEAQKTKAEEKPEQNPLLLFSMFVGQNADQDISLSIKAIDDFLITLEEVGINTTAIKNLIAEATGQPYDQIAKTAPQERVSFAGYYTGNDEPLVRNEGFDSAKALKIAASDNAGAGYCAKGTANILEKMGYDIERGHAYKWDEMLPENGWVKLKGVRPENAPEGAVLVFDKNEHGGRTGGANYGHVEVVAEKDGERMFVSDKARNNWGGTVPQNFEGAYMYVGKDAPPSNLTIAHNVNAPAPSPGPG